MSRFKADFINSKAKRNVLIVETVLCLVFFIPFYLQNQLSVAGFVTDSSRSTAVVVNDPINGEYLHLYIYDNNGDLIKYETIRKIRGGVDSVTCEDDMICMHQISRKFFYNFNGEFVKREENDECIFPPLEREKKVGNTVYKYSVNPIGLETVKMYTDENVVTLFSGVSFLIAKLFVGCLIGISLILFVFVIIFPEYNKTAINKR